jgi:uncharacterized protein
MEIIIAVVAFLASLLTLISGFGLGTILLPVFGLFFPIEIAIALTGIVHLLNNLFKVGLVGKNADWKMVARFGIPSVAGGFLGAFLLNFLTKLPVLRSWNFGNHTFQMTPIKLIIGILLLFFAIYELVPALKNKTFSAKYLTFGGFLSGFFGGLSGMQGALRSAFLLNAGLKKEVFIATGVIIACLVDLTRLPVYYARFMENQLTQHANLLLIATISAFAGAYLGAKFIQKITLKTVQLVTSVMILVIGFLLIFGVV